MRELLKRYLRPPPFDDPDQAWAEHGPSEIRAGGVHRTFRFHDPAGNEIAVHDSHVTGIV